MSDSMKVGHLYPSHNAPLGVRKQNPEPASGAKFEDYLQASRLKFSHHAEVRMQQRGIALGPDQLGQIIHAIEKAEAKGAKDSLVLVHDIAMIVNIPSKTVVTALDSKSLAGNVFTDIDSAVVIS